MIEDEDFVFRTPIQLVQRRINIALATISCSSSFTRKDKNQISSFTKLLVVNGNEYFFTVAEGQYIDQTGRIPPSYDLHMTGKR